MSARIKSAKRTVLEWNRLVRKTTRKITVNPQTVLSPNLSEFISKIDASALESWEHRQASMEWEQRVFKNAKRAHADTSTYEHWFALALFAISKGNKTALRLCGDDADIIAIDDDVYKASLTAMDICLLALKRSSELKYTKSLHAIGEAIAIHHKTNHASMDKWMGSLFRSHVKASSGYLPEKWLTELSHRDQIRRDLILAMHANSTVIGSMLNKPEQRTIKDASQLKTIDAFGIHESVARISKYFYVDNTLATTCLKNMLAFAKTAKIDIDMKRVYKGDRDQFIARSIPESVERALHEAAYDQAFAPFVSSNKSSAIIAATQFLVETGYQPSSIQSLPINGFSEDFRSAFLGFHEQKQLNSSLMPKVDSRQNKSKITGNTSSTPANEQPEKATFDQKPQAIRKRL